MKIYLASTYARASEMYSAALLIAARGHEVVSQWHMQPEEERRREFEQGAMKAAYPDLTFEAYCGIQNIEDMSACDLFLMFTDTEDDKYQSTGGRHFELGFILGKTGKVAAIVGEPENVFQEIRAVRKHPDFEHFLEHLETYALGIFVGEQRHVKT